MAAIPNYTELTRDISANLNQMRSDQPDLMKALGDLSSTALREGVLSTKTKELIAIAIAVTNRCDACIGFHARALVKLGATLQEVEEALGMCVYMGGGPSLMYTANALAAFKEFSQSA